MFAVFFHHVSATCLEWKIYSAEMIDVNLVGDINLSGGLSAVKLFMVKVQVLPIFTKADVLLCR